MVVTGKKKPPHFGWCINNCLYLVGKLPKPFQTYISQIGSYHIPRDRGENTSRLDGSTSVPNQPMKPNGQLSLKNA